jgi:hypothetical protein
MNGFIVRVNAYYGEPVFVKGIPARAGYRHDMSVPSERIVNDPEVDLDVERLVEDFEAWNGCKVNFDSDYMVEGGFLVFEFDVFEPSWEDEDEAKDIIDDLTERLVDWVEGRPDGET